MPARITKRQPETTRSAIKTSALAQALEEHALQDRKMSPSRVRAAEILLRKTLPDRTENHNTYEDTPSNPEELEAKFMAMIDNLPESMLNKLIERITQRLPEGSENNMPVKSDSKYSGADTGAENPGQDSQGLH